MKNFQLLNCVREKLRLIDWSINRFFGRLIDWSIGWLIDGLVGWLIDWRIGWLIDWLMDWWIGWLVDWWIGWLITWLIMSLVWFFSNFRPASNMSSALNRIKRFNALIKAKLDVPVEGANCTERVVPCDHTSKFRTISGWCNNLDHPDWGSAERIYGRILDPSYADGLDEPRNMSVTGAALPSPREVQIVVVTDLDRPHPLYTVRAFCFFVIPSIFWERI